MKKFNKHLYDNINREYDRKNLYLYEVSVLQEKIEAATGKEKENLEKVLDKFFQEDYNKAGSGLGLAISNEIVKLHGGKMILNSKKGVGTSITVKIKNTLIKSI